ATTELEAGKLGIVVSQLNGVKAQERSRDVNVGRVLDVRPSECGDGAIFAEARLTDYSADARNCERPASRCRHREKLRSRTDGRNEIDRASIWGPARRTGLILESWGDITDNAAIRRHYREMKLA